MEFPAIVVSVCCSFVLGVGVTFALLLLLCCCCAAVGPALNFTVYCVLLRSGVVCLFLDHRSIISELQAWWRAVLRGWTLVVETNSMPLLQLPLTKRTAASDTCARCYRSRQVDCYGSERYCEVGRCVCKNPIPCHCCRFSLAVIAVVKSIAIVFNQVWRFWR
jgi:hypothetical protein